MLRYDNIILARLRDSSALNYIELGPLDAIIC